MIDKNRVIEILQKHPKGLKAKEIATFVSGTDRKAVNHILYSNPRLFSCDEDYRWTLSSNVKSKVETRQKSKKSNSVDYKQLLPDNSNGKSKPVKRTENSEAEIQKCFSGYVVCGDSLAFLKKVEPALLELIGKRYSLLSKSVGSSAFGFIVRRNTLEYLSVMTNNNFEKAQMRFEQIQTRALIIEDYDTWLKIMSLSDHDFCEFIKRITVVFRSVVNNSIQKPSPQECIRLALLTPSAFKAALCVKEIEYDNYIRKQEEIERISKEVGKIINDSQNKPIKQCHGNCATCTRDECVLDKS